MNELIDGLLNDQRLDWLANSEEYKWVRSRLLYMQKRLGNNTLLTDEQKEYLFKIQAHIKHVQPHTKPITVNGEVVPVTFVYKEVE